MHSEGIVGPGRVLTKAERRQRSSEAEALQATQEAGRAQRRSKQKSAGKDGTRVDSTISTTEDRNDDEIEQEERERYESSFHALWSKMENAMRAWHWLIRLGNDIDEHFAPNACITTYGDFRSGRRPNSIRGLILLLIFFLVVFGSLWTVVGYLLAAISVSACDVTTVYIPFTQTETVTATTSIPRSHALARPASDARQGMSTLDYTSTSTHTVTSFVTVPADTSASTLPFVFTVDPAGSTHWINGVSPSFGVSVVTATTSIFLSPSDAATLATQKPRRMSLS